MLTALKLKTVQPRERPYKLADSEGLYLLVAPTGGKLWRYKYRFDGREKLLALGAFDDVSLKEAREKRDEARKLLKSGVDPSADKKRAKARRRISAANSFAAVAREWHAKRLHEWTDRHSGYVLRRMERDLFPLLGSRPIAEIEAPEVLEALQRVEARGAHVMARRARQYVSAVMRYAIVTGRAKRDVAMDLKGALAAKPKTRHVTALPLADLPEFLGKLATYEGHPQTALAIRLLMLTAVRTSELIGARWDEIDGDTWRIPAARMKMDEDHIVPLSTQALAVLDELRGVSGTCDLLFPSPRNDRVPMSNNTILYAMYRMGFHSRATGHGMRTLFSTTLNEQGFHADVIERQLAHKEGNPVRAAYNRAKWLPERRRMMQQWGDYLDSIR